MILVTKYFGDLAIFVLTFSSEGSVYTLYQIGDEKRLMNYFDGEESALNLLKKAIEIRESSLLYHSYALAILKLD